jgi:predicted transcriptional regulator YdeE
MIEGTQIILLNEFYIAGISVKTTNRNNQSQKDIGELWTQFMEGNIIEQISDRISNDILCLHQL